MYMILGIFIIEKKKIKEYLNEKKVWKQSTKNGHQNSFQFLMNIFTNQYQSVQKLVCSSRILQI
ncbi:hypothetical protein pb186bvf_007868 [Paramecium bursaria]